MRKLLFLLLLLGVSSPVFAQTATPNSKIQWNHDGLDVVSWQVVYDTQPPITVNPTKVLAPDPDATSIGTWRVQIQALTTGTHTVFVSACNEAGCRNSSQLTFTFKNIPGPISSLVIK